MKKWIQEQKQFKDERGLTLVELLAVIVILAIVATIAFVAIGNVMENSKKDALVSNGLQMIEAAKLYEANGGTVGSSEVTISTLQDEEKNRVLEEMYGPWDKQKITSGGVKKEDGEYKVNLTTEDGAKLEDVTEEDLMGDESRSKVSGPTS